jgi:hypothetical protein
MNNWKSTNKTSLFFEINYLFILNLIEGCAHTPKRAYNHPLFSLPRPVLMGLACCHEDNWCRLGGG